MISHRSKEIDIFKSLQELENSDWGEPQSDSLLEKKCLKLRQIPLIGLDRSELICLINQSIGLEYLIPMALKILRIDPLADRHLYPGCLLSALLKAPYEYWEKNPEVRSDVEQAYKSVLLDENNDEDFQFIKGILERDYLIFSEFGFYSQVLWDNIKIQESCHHVSVNFLAVIASRQPITKEDLENLSGSVVSEQQIEFWVKSQFIIYNYEGSYPAKRYFRISKDFMKKLGIKKRNKG